MIQFAPSKLSQLEEYGPFVQVEGFLTKDECSIISEQMKSLREARVDEKANLNLKIRSAKVGALALEHSNFWIFAKLEQAIMGCNERFYKFDLMGFQEAIQLIRYDVGDHYDWHQDFSNKHHSLRKLSVSVQLTDPSEYEGGELEFFKNGTAPKSQGTLVLFPSFMHHKVHPITKGTREAMVGWVSGHPYR